MKKRWIGFLFAACFLLLIAEKITGKTVPSNPVYGGTEEGEWEGDRIYLGSYEQDGNEENGKEPILWRVLQINKKEMLLLSEYALDVQPFHTCSEEVTWEDSSVRKWLNTEFYQKALAGWETAVKEVTCKASDNQTYGTDGGNDTKDKVFLLAWEDTYNEAYGFPKALSVISDYTGEQMQYSEVSKARLCYPTVWASGKNPLITRNHEEREDQYQQMVDGFGSVYWLLRTPGKTRKYISYISR